MKNLLNAPAQVYRIEEFYVLGYIEHPGSYLTENNGITEDIREARRFEYHLAKSISDCYPGKYIIKRVNVQFVVDETS